MDTAIKHPVSDQVKLSIVIFDIRALSGHCLLTALRSASISTKLKLYNTCNAFYPSSCTALGAGQLYD